MPFVMAGDWERPCIPSALEREPTFQLKTGFNKISPLVSVLPDLFCYVNVKNKRIKNF
jgi:hypothetical protein